MIYHSQDGSFDSDAYTLHDLDKEVGFACADLRGHIDKFNLIVATGLSGVIPSVPVSLKLKVPLAILRKPDDNTHQFGGKMFSIDRSRWISGDAVEGSRALWIDDFSVSGDTEIRINRAVKELGGRVVARYFTQDRVYVEY